MRSTLQSTTRPRELFPSFRCGTTNLIALQALEARNLDRAVAAFWWKLLLIRKAAVDALNAPEERMNLRGGKKESLLGVKENITKFSTRVLSPTNVQTALMRRLRISLKRNESPRCRAKRMHQRNNSKVAQCFQPGQQLRVSYQLFLQPWLPDVLQLQLQQLCGI